MGMLASSNVIATHKWIVNYQAKFQHKFNSFAENHTNVWTTRAVLLLSLIITS